MQLVENEVIPESVNKIRLHIKDGLEVDGPGNQMHIKDKLKKMVTFGYAGFESSR